MEHIRRIIATRNEDLEDDDFKEDLFQELVSIPDNEKVDKKHLKKLFKITLKILRFKGDQVISLLQDFDAKIDDKDENAASEVDATLKDQIEKKSKAIEKYELERIQMKNQIKDLTEEAILLKKRLQESSHLGSENEDSPDALSEIDKQQELISNINMKNKHIKRLLRDIEDLEGRSTKQVNLIEEMKLKLTESNQKVFSLANDLKENQDLIDRLENELVQEKNRIVELERQNKDLLKEKTEKESELEQFSIELQKRIKTYQKILYDKQTELNEVNKKYQQAIENTPGHSRNEYSENSEEFKTMLESVKERDMVIKNLEKKINQLTNELHDSTNVIRKYNSEKDDYVKVMLKNKNNQCCKEMKIMLEKSNQRCQEFQEVLTLLESDNTLKAKQAYEAIEALRSYENKEYGLSDALKRINHLQEIIHQKEKQIEELVRELNSVNEVVAENCILRKKLGIPEDEHIETKSFFTKQRRFVKINERLLLKLRASEEMRLQLKIDKNDLKRKISYLKTQLMKLGHPLNGTIPESAEIDIDSYSEQEERSENLTESKIPRKHSLKQCDSCQSHYDILEDARKCFNCHRKLIEELEKKNGVLELDYQNVIEENDNLRSGMREILEKLRDSDGPSRSLKTDPTAIFEKILQFLQPRHLSAPEIACDDTANISASSRSNSAEEIDELKNLIKRLSDKNEELTTQVDELIQFKFQYNEMIKNLSQNEPDKILLESLQRTNETEVVMKMYERKIDFLKIENDNFSSELKKLKLEYVTLLHDLKKEIAHKDKILVEFQSNEKRKVYNEEEQEEEEEEDNEDIDLENLNSELQRIRIEINGLCFNVLKNINIIDTKELSSINFEEFNNVTILENNLTTSFITRQEYNDMKNEIQRLKQELQQQKLKEKSLEEFAKITESQLLSQQQIIAKFSDEDISLRHLLVDLQAKNSEVYLITKSQRELREAKETEEQLKLQMENLKRELSKAQESLQLKEKLLRENEDKFKIYEHNNILKIKYLKRTLLKLCESYSSLTPSISIIDFVKNFAALVDLKKNYEQKLLELNRKSPPELEMNEILDKLKDVMKIPQSEIRNKIDALKYKSSCEYLQQQLEFNQKTIIDLQTELERIKLNQIQNEQHWNTIRMLFAEDQPSMVASSPKHDVKNIETANKAIQVQPEVNSTAINTSPPSQPATTTPVVIQVESIPTEIPQINTDNQKSLESQLKQAMILANTRSVLLIETENQLSEAQGRLKALEKTLNEKDQQLKNSVQINVDNQKDDFKRDDSILSITIATLQNLLLEKDTTLSRYQELLKTERQHHMNAYDDKMDEVKSLKKELNEKDEKLESSNSLLASLRSQIVELETKIKLLMAPSEPAAPEIKEDTRTLMELKNTELKLEVSVSEIKKLHAELNDHRMKEKLLEKSLTEKEKMVLELKEKLKTANENINTITEDRLVNSEIEQLREMLEEKDQQIQELTETLNQFHDDQQKYFDDTTVNSTEQITQISTELNRADASNRIMRTQVDALKRQVTSITQREKQAREMIKTLKNQLIRRPVISVKADKKRVSSNREENLQRKIQQYENDIIDLKDELRRQININDNKKAKNAAELGLWDKQKRYQELSEKLKTKLTEKEIDFERLKANYTALKNTLARLEKERVHLEARIRNNRFYTGKTNFCPNCNQQHLTTKYTPAHTPDSYTGTGTSINTSNSEVSSVVDLAINENNSEILNAFKARVESQQRRIIALELEGKGSNPVTLEIERLQEKLSATEAQNIRLEARNIQLQLDLDMSRQNDSEERLKRQIKHLEDYVLVLKDEISELHAKLGHFSSSSSQQAIKKMSEGQSPKQPMEQTILTMKTVIERLKSENKHLKENLNATKSGGSHSQTEVEKLQKKYNDAMNRISELKVELELQQSTCPHCNNVHMREVEAISSDLPFETQLSFVKEQLQQKTQLLEKAKILLTRAAAKERQLREQISYFKRRCCELQNIPIIEETSE